MADNVNYNEQGTTPFATDEIGGVHHQRVKISLGADGAATDLTGDGTNGADVDVTRLPSGTVAGSATLPAGANKIGSVTLRNPGDTADMGDATNPVRVDPTGATTQPVSAAQLPASLVSGRLDVSLGAAPATVTVDSELPAAVALSDALANPTTPLVGAAALEWDGSTWRRSRGAEIDTGNSSTATLGNGGNFTGAWKDVTNYPSIVVSIFADQASAVDGVKFQWSSDGTNLDIEEMAEIAASDGRSYSLSPRAQFFRVNYTNGTTPQTAFRLETILRSREVGFFTRPLDKTIDDTFFAQLSRTVLAAKRNDGTYGNIRSTNGNNLKVSVSELDGISTQDAGRVFVKNPGGTNMGDATTPVRTDPTGTTTQPVSGTVTANAGSGPFPVSDNSGSLTVDAPVGTPVASRLSDGSAFLTTTGGRLSVDGSGVTQPISGTVTANAGTGPFPVSDNAGSLTVDAPVGTPVAARLSDGAAFLTTTGGRLSVDGSGVTQPISAASLPLPTGAATETTLGTRLAETTFTGRINTQGQKTMSASTPVVVASDQSAIPVYPVGGQIRDETGTLRTVNRAFVNATASGSTSVVGTQGPGVRIRVLSYSLVADASVIAHFRSATTAITSSKAVAANGGLAESLNQHGLFQTNANEALNINLNAAVNVGVDVTWIQAT